MNELCTVNIDEILERNLLLYKICIKKKCRKLLYNLYHMFFSNRQLKSNPIFNKTIDYVNIYKVIFFFKFINMFINFF